MLAAMRGFEGRVALVTGAGSPTGIGFACARVLGGGGAAVAVAATTERIHERASELGAEGVDAAGFIADLTDAGDARAMVAAVLERFGRIDVLVNNAGMFQTGFDGDAEGARVAELTEERFDRDIALNLKTAFNVTRAVLSGMLERGYGRIVMVGSVTGSIATNPENAGYAAAKAGMDGLMRTIALEAGRSGVTCNSVLPGWIASGSQLPEEAIAGRNTPIGRSGTPEEIAAAVLFLASEDASYVTGHALVVDGGNTIQEYKGPSEAWY
jgi:3-oxoacyl-[acyl-carrier protein] reductase